MKNELGTPSWDNSNIYKNFQDPKIAEDIKKVESQITYLNSKMSLFEKLVPTLASAKLTALAETIPLARECYRIETDCKISLYTLNVYASTASSVDSLDYAAKDLASQVTKTMAELNKATKPLALFLLRSPQDYLTEFLKSDAVSEMQFPLQYEREVNDFLLGVSEEVLLEGHVVDGFHAWGKLYTDIAGALKLELDGKTLGVASASNILFQSDRTQREKAYRAINQAWEGVEISAAAVQNSLHGWRLENNKARSSKKELHYLDKSCHQQKITRATLEALMQTTYEERHIGQEAIRLMAKEMKIEKLGPWDVLAPFPSQTETRKIPFSEAMQMIKGSFYEFNPEMAEFAQHMVDKNWIDATPTENRASGAYCTGFRSVREPRVFITYDGSMKNVITLAHEIGHAYHSWVMRDLKFGQTFYSMTLAETASIFAETLVRNTLLAQAKTPDEKKQILWQELESASSLLINIPARYDFECRAVELRKTKSVTAPEYKKLTQQAWQHWYEDTLSEYNEMFWASKMHFSMSHVSFYNYPYLFGYLFSLGIYAKKDQYGADFKKLYIDILRDTGVMTAEDLIKKHFNEDISKKDFWKNSLKIVEKSVQDYKKLV